MSSIASDRRFWQVFTFVMLYIGTVWLAIGLVSGVTIFVVCPGLVGLALAVLGAWRIRGGRPH